MYFIFFVLVIFFELSYKLFEFGFFFLKCSCMLFFHAFDSVFGLAILCVFELFVLGLGLLFAERLHFGDLFLCLGVALYFGLQPIYDLCFFFDEGM